MPVRQYEKITYLASSGLGYHRLVLHTIVQEVRIEEG